MNKNKLSDWHALLLPAVTECRNLASATTAIELRSECTRITQASPWVTVNMHAGEPLLPMLSGAGAHAWQGIFDPSSREPADFLYDGCLNASLNGGYFHRVDGEILKWQLHGSGSRALDNWFTSLRWSGLMPNLDFTSAERGNWLEDIAQTMHGQPYHTRRLASLAQLAEPQRRERLNAIVAGMLEHDVLRVTLRDIDLVADVYPAGLGEDPLRKKAHLALLFLASRMHHSGYRVEWDALFPADYQLPRGLERGGIISLHPSLSALVAEEMLPPACVAVTHIRAATVHAVMELADRSRTPAWLVDGALFTSWRNEPCFEEEAPAPMRIDGDWF